MRCFLSSWAAELIQIGGADVAARQKNMQGNRSNSASDVASAEVAIAAQPTIQMLTLLERDRENSLVVLREVAAVLGRQAAALALQLPSDNASGNGLKRKYSEMMDTPEEKLQVMLGMQFGVSPDDALVQVTRRATFCAHSESVRRYCSCDVLSFLPNGHSKFEHSVPPLSIVHAQLAAATIHTH